ncbi:MAG: hypothetical protein WC782_10125 [Methylococcaceae bacterium]|jgi:hypothetical protein
MTNTEKTPGQASAVEERRLTLDERRLELESSFARKWLPTIATAIIGLSAALLGYVQNKVSNDATERSRVEARLKDEREWGFKVVEMYFQRRELFDLSKNPEQAAANLKVLVAVAPAAVQGLLSAEQSRLPLPGGDETQQAARLSGLAVLADIQTAIEDRRDNHATQTTSARVPSSFVVYVQYPEGQQEAASIAQTTLQHMGYKAPGIELVRNVPSRLQVRYYRVDQKGLASSLVMSMGKTLNLPVSSDNAIRVQSDKALPDGILELWLPKASPQ